MNGYPTLIFQIIGIIYSQDLSKLEYGMFHVMIIQKIKNNKLKSIYIKQMKTLNQLRNNFFVLMFL